MESGRDSFDSDFGNSSDEQDKEKGQVKEDDGEAAENELIKEERRELKKKVKIVGIKKNKV